MRYTEKLGFLYWNFLNVVNPHFPDYTPTSKNLSGGESKKLANEIQKQITALLGMNSRGIKEEAFYVLRNNNMPSVLIELGFVTNKKDAEKLNSDKYRDLFAEAIFRGIVNYFKM